MQLLPIIEFFALSWLAVTVNLVCHEAGHAVEAWAMRFRLREIRLGSGWEILRRTVGPCRIHLYALPQGGCVIAFPRSLRWQRARMFIYAAGGPLA
jgi:hypothetical protein